MLENMTIGIIRKTTGDNIDGPSSTTSIHLLNERKSRSTMSIFGVMFIRIGDSLVDGLAAIFSTCTNGRPSRVRGWDVFGLDSDHRIICSLIGVI